MTTPPRGELSPVECDAVQGWIWRELDGELDASAQVRLATHLQGCAACTAHAARERTRALDVAEACQELLNGLEVRLERVSVEASLNGVGQHKAQALRTPVRPSMTRVGGQQDATPRRTLTGDPMRRWLRIAATVLLFVGAGSWLTNRQSPIESEPTDQWARGVRVVGDGFRAGGFRAGALDDASIALSQGTALEPNQVVLSTTAGQVHFPGGSRAELEAGVRFSMPGRRPGPGLDLLEGSARFRIVRSEVGFTVQTAVATVIVLGTEFTVRHVCAGTDGMPRTEITVHEGVVEVLRLAGTGTPVRLPAGQRAVVTPQWLTVSPLPVSPVSVSPLSGLNVSQPAALDAQSPPTAPGAPADPAAPWQGAEKPGVDALPPPAQPVDLPPPQKNGRAPKPR